MMRILIILPLLALGLAGCSKKESADVSQETPATNDQAAADQAVAEPAAEPAPAEPAPAPDPAVDNAMIAQDLNAVPDTLQKQDFDGAVDALSAANLAAQTDEQKRAYQEQLYRTLEALQKQAETDAKAREAYERLGRRTMGR